MFTYFPVTSVASVEQPSTNGFKLEKWYRARIIKANQPRYYPQDGTLIQDCNGHYFAKLGALLQVIFRIDVPAERYHVALLGRTQVWT